MREAMIKLSDEWLEAIGYGGLVSLYREADLKEVELLEDDGVRSVPQIEVETRLDEAQLNELDCVDHWELVDERENSYLYVTEMKAFEMPEGAEVHHDDLVGMCDPEPVDRGLLLSLVGSQEAIRIVLHNQQQAGVLP